MQKTWGAVFESPDFPQKFIRLTQDLDAESCETVIRVLTRIRQTIDSKKSWLDFYTEEEQKELRLVQEKCAAVMRLSDGLFAWENYLFPRNVALHIIHMRQVFPRLKTLDAVKGRAVIDAGGYVGDSVLVFQELEPSAIYTFEPVPEHFELLKRTLELNRIANAVAENIALGAENGEATMRVDGEGSSIKVDAFAKRGELITVPVRTLDDYVAEHPMQIGLIKTDLEGAEPDFIEGAKRTICEQKPILLISIYHNPHDFFEIKPLLESWGLGYRFRIYRHKLGGSHHDTLLIGEAS